MQKASVVRNQTNAEKRADEKLTLCKPAARFGNKRKVNAGNGLPEFVKTQQK